MSTNQSTTNSTHQLLSGNDAVMRIMLEQKQRDQNAGFNTAGFISGYRGSPLGTLDMTLWSAEALLKSKDIHFTPGVNEELAATSAWGSQYVSRQEGAFAGAKFDGVFAVWYGKGPGVDRSGDALKHGNLAGSSPLGGVLVLAGDDHAAKSSTTAHQSDQALVAAGIPVLYPSNVHDILHLGLHGLAMSRHSGCWVSLKLVTDVMETTSTVDFSALGPQHHVVGETARASRVQDQPRMAEERLMRHKLPAVLEYARKHHLNRTVVNSTNARLGLIAAGKSYGDLLQALDMMGLTPGQCEQLGLRILKLDMVWPLDPQTVASFVGGLERVLVIEEKRSLVEEQLKAAIYDLPVSTSHPVVEGKVHFPNWGELTPQWVAEVLTRWLQLEPSNQVQPALTTSPIAAPRLPSFCSGCPHSTSTRVPDGSRALAGIGCHGMATFRQIGVTTTWSQMGGEGAMWIGQAPFLETPHVFANMGDGTYFHSGLLAIRATVAAKVRMTYKILVNGFVSMTGGQPIDGELDVASMIQSLLAEGVKRVVVVTDEPSKYHGKTLPGQVPVRHRRELDIVQRELREEPGVTVLIYEQPCASERRRLRKRGTLPDPAIRTFIHPDVCEGCGDCGKASDCLSLEPLETPLGRKRQINQSSCNKDRSCVEGFCPSFVTVHGGKFRDSGKGALKQPPDAQSIPLPLISPLTSAYNILFAGIGGTGVVTASNVLAQAAQLAGLQVSTLDVTGLSQKYGGVQGHLRIAPLGMDLPASRIAQGQVDVLVGCDALVSGEADVLHRLRPQLAKVVVNTTLLPTADFTRNPDWAVDVDAVVASIRNASSDLVAADAARIAADQLGDAIGANLMLLGMAWQRGWIPIALETMSQAIHEQPGAAFNAAAFDLGRRTAHQLTSTVLQEQTITFHPKRDESLAALMTLHQDKLMEYQGQALATRYRDVVQKLAQLEHSAGLGERLTRAAAKGYFKLLAHKDEFEVARLLTNETFHQELKSQFEGPVQLHAHLGGGFLSKNDAVTGKPVKRELKGWIWGALKLLASLRKIRGTVVDPWRKNPERLLAQRWLLQYEADLQLIRSSLSQACTASTYDLLCQLAQTPQKLRGYGHVREASSKQALAHRVEILKNLNHSTQRIAA